MSDLVSKYNHLPKAVKASLWFTICSILQKGISFLTVPIFTRMLSVEEYGVISLFGAWQSILMIFATLNLSYQIFNNGMVKFENDRAGYTTAMLGLSNVVTLIIFVFYLAFYSVLDNFFELPIEAMIMMFAGFIFSAAIDLWSVQQRYLFEYRLLCFATLCMTIGSAILGIIFVYWDATGISRILGMTIATIVTGCGVYGLVLSKNRKLINFAYWKYALKLDLPLIPHYLSMMVLVHSDRIMINSLCGKFFTALYSVPYNASIVMQIVISGINASFLPWTYQKCKAKEYRKLNELSSFLLIIVMFISLIPSLFAPELVWILGSEQYSESVWVVPPVSCSVFFLFLYSLFSNIEFYYEKNQNVMIASFCAAVGNVILNAIFISFFGYLAAAYTTLACYVILSVAHYYFMVNVCREQDIREPIYNVKLIMVLSLFVILYSIFVSFLFDKAPWIRYAMVAFILLMIIVKKDMIFLNLAIIKSKNE